MSKPERLDLIEKHWNEVTIPGSPLDLEGRWLLRRIRTYQDVLNQIASGEYNDTAESLAARVLAEEE